MNKQEKIQEVEGFKTDFERAGAVFFADYKGIASNDLNDLRAQLRPLNVRYSVVKNNLVRKALKGTAKEELASKLVGPTAAVFSFEDAAAVAKKLSEFAKEQDLFELKSGFLGDSEIGVDQIKQLADLPSREVLLSQLLSAMNGPIQNFVLVLNAIPRSLVQVLQAIADKKAEGGE